MILVRKKGGSVGPKLRTYKKAVADHVGCQSMFVVQYMIFIEWIAFETDFDQNYLGYFCIENVFFFFFFFFWGGGGERGCL